MDLIKETWLVSEHFLCQMNLSREEQEGIEVMARNDFAKLKAKRPDFVPDNSLFPVVVQTVDDLEERVNKVEELYEALHPDISGDSRNISGSSGRGQRSQGLG